jgi:hypothetical protein
LGFDPNNAGAQALPDEEAIADMGPHIKAQVAWPDELRVEFAHPAQFDRVPVV